MYAKASSKVGVRSLICIILCSWVCTDAVITPSSPCYEWVYDMFHETSPHDHRPCDDPRDHLSTYQHGHDQWSLRHRLTGVNVSHLQPDILIYAACLQILRHNYIKAAAGDKRNIPRNKRPQCHSELSHVLPNRRTGCMFVYTYIVIDLRIRYLVAEMQGRWSFGSRTSRIRTHGWLV